MIAGDVEETASWLANSRASWPRLWWTMSWQALDRVGGAMSL